MMMAMRFMPRTRTSRINAVPYWRGRVFSISVPAVASTYIWYGRDMTALKTESGIFGV